MSKKTVHIVMGLIVALLLVVPGTANLAYADDVIQDSITLSPPTRHYNLDAGEVKQDDLTIINYGDIAYDFIVYTGPYSVKDEAYTPDYITEASGSDAYRWVSFTQTRWHAEPKQTIRVPYAVTVSKGAAAGAHNGAIFIETQPQNPDSGISRKKRLALLLYTNINGPTKTSGSVVSASTAWFRPTAPLTSTVRFENTGETDFPADLTYAVFDVFGNVKYQTEKEVMLLPGTKRAVDLEWDGASWIGLYKVHIQTHLLGKTQTYDSYTFVVPRWLLFIIGLALIVGVADVLRRKKAQPKSLRRHR